MKRKPKLKGMAVSPRGRAAGPPGDLPVELIDRPAMAELYRRAKARVRQQKHAADGELSVPRAKADVVRLVQQLQIHQVELEMQNAELKAARDGLEALLERYTDLYDYAPVGYCSLDERGRILEINLTGAALLGVARSRLLPRPFQSLLAPNGRPVFLAFLARVFRGGGQQVTEAKVSKEGGAPFWANLHGTRATSGAGGQPVCRLIISDVTRVKQAEDAQRRLDALALANRELSEEVVRRQAVEDALRESERHQAQLLQQSHRMQAKLRAMSRRILQAQEEERKRISRELHDEIAQTLVGINVRLEALAREVMLNPSRLRLKIARTQRLVEKSVRIVHEFARELRPLVLDDLGLTAALHSFLREFVERTGIQVRFRTFRGVDPLNSTQRTVVYRVVHAALTNVAQHAAASQAQVDVRKVLRGVRLEIHDNGRSFDVEHLNSSRGRKRLGLLGMRERVEMIGGRFTIESAPGHGTTIRAHIPLGKGSRR